MMRLNKFNKISWISDVNMYVEMRILNFFHLVRLLFVNDPFCSFFSIVQKNWFCLFSKLSLVFQTFVRNNCLSNRKTMVFQKFCSTNCSFCKRKFIRSVKNNSFIKLVWMVFNCSFCYVLFFLFGFFCVRFLK